MFLSMASHKYNKINPQFGQGIVNAAQDDND